MTAQPGTSPTSSRGSRARPRRAESARLPIAEVTVAHVGPFVEASAVPEAQHENTRVNGVDHGQGKDQEDHLDEHQNLGPTSALDQLVPRRLGPMPPTVCVRCCIWRRKPVSVWHRKRHRRSASTYCSKRPRPANTTASSFSKSILRNSGGGKQSTPIGKRCAGDRVRLFCGIVKRRRILSRVAPVRNRNLIN